MITELEQLWADLLSEDADLVRPALRGLQSEDRQAVLSHLHAMAAEPGWSDGQARRARSALVIAAADSGPANARD